MNINPGDINAVSGFFVVDFPVYEQTLCETKITERWDLGSVAIIHGTRYGEPIWILDNPQGPYGIWVEESK